MAKKDSIKWINDSWCIAPLPSGKWSVGYGIEDEDFAYCGVYRNRRRAKKEITHYIEKALHFCHRGAHSKTRRRLLTLKRARKNGC